MLARTIAIAALDPMRFAQSVDRLAEILHACVHEGASIGFILPFGMDEARGYWRHRVAPSLAAGGKFVIIATLGGDVAGTAQLDLELDAEQAPSR